MVYILYIFHLCHFFISFWAISKSSDYICTDNCRISNKATKYWDSSKCRYLSVHSIIFYLFALN